MALNWKTAHEYTYPDLKGLIINDMGIIPVFSEKERKVENTQGIVHLMKTHLTMGFDKLRKEQHFGSYKKC